MLSKFGYVVDAVGFRGEEDSLVSLNNKVLKSNFVFLIRLNGSVFTKSERKGNVLANSLFI